MTLVQNTVTDIYGRTMKKLRVQLTDSCQLRCFYCMPVQPKFTEHKDLLSADEIESIVAALVPFGLSEIRLTGGEPTVRKDFLEIARRLSPFAKEKFGLTSNALLLDKYLEPLRSETTLRHLNISLDTFQPEKFAMISGIPRQVSAPARILATLRKAKALGFHVKINCVLFRSINEDEIMDFVRFSETENIEVRFLEYMNIGPRYAEFQNRYLSAKAALETISAERELSPLPVAHDSTSYNFSTQLGGIIGFIASESEPFCGTCSRLRLTATGFLRSCLFSEKGLLLKGQKPEEFEKLIREVVAMKPIGRMRAAWRPMNEIGG